jgi:hypothetical protein
MGGYVLSYDNRYYVALEEEFGRAGAVSAASRFPGIKLTARQRSEQRERRDKSGSRTFMGLAPGHRRRTEYGVQLYMTEWAGGQAGPAYGPFFQAGLGAAPKFWAGGVAGSGSTASRIQFSGPHGLTPGQAVAAGGEIRFVAAVLDAQTVQLAAPFSVSPAGGTLSGTVTYGPGRELPSVSIYDYWGPSAAVQRLLCGAMVDRLRIKVNADFHEFEFSGPAADLLDSSSFESGEGGLEQYPQEPAVEAASFSVIPGNLGQAWMGPEPAQFFTVTEAEVEVDNDIEMRSREFGSTTPRGASPGIRRVAVSFSLYAATDAATKALYQAARQYSPVSVMLQLGQQAGQLCGVYLKSVVPEVPEFDDSGRRLEWKFSSSRAQGTVDDEIYVAFG